MWYDVLTLNIVTKTVHAIDYQEFDRFVEEVYGQPFSFPADMESRNDTSHTMLADREGVPEYERADLDRFIATGEGQFLADTLLQDMCHRGLIPEGEYLINVCW